MYQFFVEPEQIISGKSLSISVGGYFFLGSFCEAENFCSVFFPNSCPFFSVLAPKSSKCFSKLSSYALSILIPFFIFSFASLNAFAAVLTGRIMRLIAERLKSEVRSGRTILVITHDRELIESCCDTVVEVEKRLP